MNYKPIPNFENYCATKDGYIWNNIKHRFLKQCFSSSHGYPTVSINGRNWLVHRLILETFVGKCPDDMECRHLNGIKIDNNLENLCWGTRKENVQDAIKHGTFFKLQPRDNSGIKSGMSKLTEQNVRMIIYMYQTGEFTQKEIAKVYNVDQTNVHCIINKKSWKSIWEKQYGFQNI